MSEWPPPYIQRLVWPADNLTRQWVRGIGIAAAVGFAYYLTVEVTILGLVLQPEDIAVFWPAAGISSGFLISIGARARWPVVAGVIAAYFVAAIYRQNLWVTLAHAICNAAEPLIIAGLITRYFGADFSIDRLRAVLGLLAATLVGCAVSSFGATVVSRLQIGPSAANLSIGLHWFASVVLGVLAVAPLIIELFHALREPPPRNELAAGAVLLLTLGVMTGAIIAWLPPLPWETVMPGAFLLPVLLWLAARSQPFFAAAGAFIVSLIVTWTANFGIGHFGDTGLPTDTRILQAQAVILEVTIVAYVLAALFEERRKNEVRLAHSNMMLERERDNKLMSLQAAVASISHEINQPLGSIALNAEVARAILQDDPPDLEEARSALNDIIGDNKRAGEILASVRQLFGKSERKKNLADVNEAALAVLRFLRQELNDHQVTTAADLAAVSPLVTGHRVQLEEVIANLVRNAIQAMDAVEPARRALKVRTRLDGTRKVIVVVEDTGPGIHPESLNSIFDAFVTTKVDGAGLGLAICRTIIESHGGELTASSDGKSGALFQIVLPIEPADKRAQRDDPDNRTNAAAN